VALLQNLLTLTVAGRAPHPNWLHAVSVTLQWFGFASLVLLGYGLGYLLDRRKAIRKDAQDDPREGHRDNRPQNTSWLLRGLSLQLGISFIASGLEQYFDLADIHKWFIDSGYTGNFTYVIIAIQIIAGTFLLFNRNPYAKTATIIILLAVMVGAVLTHIHRGDKFPIMIAATTLAIKCILLLWICRTHYRPTWRR
jgi:hypothetical protein